MIELVLDPLSNLVLLNTERPVFQCSHPLSVSITQSVVLTDY